MGKLTALRVKTAPPGRYVDGDGLYLKVNEGGSRQWSLRVAMPNPDGGKGTLREFGLGSANSIALADARLKAAEWRALAKRGIDPKIKLAADRRALALEQARNARTFRFAALEYIAREEKNWKNEKHRRQWTSSLEAYVFPKFGDVAVNDIDAATVMDALDGIWLSKKETARRVLQRVCAVLDYAHIRNWRDYDAPVRAIRKGLGPQKKKVRHHPAVDVKQAPSFFALLRASPQTVARLGLEFAILTACRSGEVRHARWTEIDLANRLWTIPGERMKGTERDDHVVPLSDAAIDVLYRASPFRKFDDAIIFPGLGGNAMSDMTLNKAQKLIAPETTQHGWRSTFRDWVADETKFEADVAEAALAHVVKDQTVAAYLRTKYLEKRIPLMAAWASFLLGEGADVKNIGDARAKRDMAA